MTTDRDPLCIESGHDRKGIVTSGTEGEAHAAVNVCDREECIQDAKDWVWEVTGLNGIHRPDKPPSYPEHEKMAAISDQASSIGAFLEWMMYDQHIMFMKEPDNPHYEHPVMDGRPIEQLLAAYFNINLEILNKEKRDMLAVQRKLNEEAGLG